MQLWRLAVAVSLAHGFSVAQAQTSGADLFNSACAHCHGENGQGGPLAPSILQRVAETDDAELIAFLRVGAPNRGMPPAPVTGEQMTALVDYLRFLGAAADSESGPDPARAVAVDARIAAFRPVTDAVLQNPDDADWLGPARKRDGRGFSPLDQLNAANVDRLALAWARGLPAGPLSAAPIVYAGIMFVALPDASIAALAAATGDVLWQRAGDAGPVRSLALRGDSLYVVPERGTVFALDARTGAPRTDAAPLDAAPRDEAASGSVLETAGGLTFRGGDDGRYEAADSASGNVLWRTILGGPISTGGISYAVDGRQYVAVIAGGGRASTEADASDSADSGSIDVPGALYVFALPDAATQAQQ